MPAAPPVVYATLSNGLSSKPYILGITPASGSPHLLLRHPSPEITVADNQSLQAVDVLKGGHTQNVTGISSEGGAIWSSSKDSSVVRWDERSRRPGLTIKAFIRKPIPVTALATSERDNLVIGGTELVSSEAHILFWDTRNAKEPMYQHSSTHSDDITHLSLLPSTSSFLQSTSAHPLPPRLLLSASTDGLVALSNLKETDEEEAVQAEENWGQSIADAGAYLHKGKMKVWARSDMDGVATWDIGKGDEEDLELENFSEYGMDVFRGRDFQPPNVGPSTVHTAVEEREQKDGRFKSEYLVDVVPSLGTSKQGAPVCSVGNNEGDIVMLHESKQTFEPSAYFLSGPGATRGHKDVVRALYHAVADEAIYTGSEDGVLSGWSLASLPQRLRVGDADVDDDGGDGREDIDSEDESEESEIETEESEMDVDGSESEDEKGPRYGPIIGAAIASKSRKDKRKEKRHNPY